jgi:hypothetical protein
VTTSTLFAVEVTVGATPPGHLTEAGQVIVEFPEEPWANTSVMTYTFVLDGTFEKFSVVIDASKAILNTLPSEQFSVVVAEAVTEVLT